ncbi:fungal-specific transcription factor domain-containing protein [Ilyonectria sp. MPI-CAGE-AT-0026]|nr:fungal-specific transcription factor domain-containing protein [Ilyonectria sp. MPI-CAGE-AT-0026]
MGRKYRVRFVNPAPNPLPPLPRPPAAADAIANIDGEAQPRPCQNRQAIRSRLACEECRSRRVKCDEVFPVCLRCQRRGTVCHPRARPPGWHIEIPWLVNPGLNPWKTRPNARLLQFWLEIVSHILTMSPDHNPLSFPLIPLLADSPSLLHAVQSISAGYEVFFKLSELDLCLRERGLALQLIRKELQEHTAGSAISPASVLSIFVLGISASWAEAAPHTYGKEHLVAGRVMLDKLLNDDKTRSDPITTFLLGWYLHWDMACSLIASVDGLLPLDTLEMTLALREAQSSFHPMTGFSTELFRLLSSLGRHCRRVCEHGNQQRDEALETALYRQLVSWQSTCKGQDHVNMNESFKYHGLITLGRVCNQVGQPCLDKAKAPEWTSETEVEAQIRSCTLKCLDAIFVVPLDSPCINYQAIPLLTAGAELTSGDVLSRGKVVELFRAMYSRNRLQANLWAIELLEELWALRDLGISMSWMELQMQKQWVLQFG